ncbi:hypothetical protein CYMTET_21084 [Cymbomonas tetramitiformis]|uniref:Uncharacterized protein n=1 Tax=Cymbomonas tetramitiformis TaxID=36881 RepID=A0AAE0G321_9CHLO|nr:hypothetical protein CYMTET_21084 [Cymbomonas tetramitiformis]
MQRGRPQFVAAPISARDDAPDPDAGFSWPQLASGASLVCRPLYCITPPVPPTPPSPPSPPPALPSITTPITIPTAFAPIFQSHPQRPHFPPSSRPSSASTIPTTTFPTSTSPFPTPPNPPPPRPPPPSPPPPRTNQGSTASEEDDEELTEQPWFIAVVVITSLVAISPGMLLAYKVVTAKAEAAGPLSAQRAARETSEQAAKERSGVTSNADDRVSTPVIKPAQAAWI